MLRRLPLLLALPLLLWNAPAGVAGSSGIDDVSAVELPERGALFGAYVKVDDHNGDDRREALTNFEALVGRQMAIERVYDNWEEAWPTADDLWSRDQGRILYYSWNASRGDGSGCSDWADIAAGVYDTEVDAKAAAVKDFAAPLFFAFHHEPMTGAPGGGTCGTPEEFIAAWQHVVTRFEAAGVTNVTWAWTVTAQSFLRDNAINYYPGNAWVDVIAADGYNWYGCEFHQGPWREFDVIFQPMYDFGIDHGKPMIIAEYGTGEDDIPEDGEQGTKAQWFTNAADTLKGWPEVKGISYFNVGSSCARYVDSSTESLAAFQANGADPYFNPPMDQVDVTVRDFRFTPQSPNSARGIVTQWSFAGPSDHTVTDASGIGLYDSGPMPAGSTFVQFFNGAGTYSYACSIHPTMTAVVKVPVSASPRTGSESTEFTITWAANRAPSGFAFDVQIKRPGSDFWANWITETPEVRGTFVPDAGPGSYAFRARYRDTATDEATGYSKPTSIIVS
jgi:plastocyanin